MASEEVKNFIPRVKAEEEVILLSVLLVGPIFILFLD